MTDDQKSTETLQGDGEDIIRIDTGKARILVRGDGSVRIEGRRVTQVADGAIVLNGATIELN